jgi:hypothetical protein
MRRHAPDLRRDPCGRRGGHAIRAGTTAGDRSRVSGGLLDARTRRTNGRGTLVGAGGGSLLGVGRTVGGGKTLEFEFLQIREEDHGLFYVAKPSNQPEASFKLTAHSADSVTFENPTHDFPQRIIYRRSGDALFARTEGTTNGRTRGVDFPYTRTACAP